MKVKFVTIIIITAGLLAASCGQNPIFYTIAAETAPKKPHIEGAPTNMVIFNREYPNPDYPEFSEDPVVEVPIVYVASGKLHWYAKTALGTGDLRWDPAEYRIDQPGGKIISLAATSERLYALCMEGHGVNAVLRYVNKNNEQWTEIKSTVNDYPLLQSISVDPELERVFLSVRKRSAAAYAIICMDDNDAFVLLKENTGEFSGVVSRNGIHYLCTKGDSVLKISGGIFTVNDADLLAGAVLDDSNKLTDASDIEADKLNNDRDFIGIIKLNELDDPMIIAVERKGGALFEVNESSFKRMMYSGGDRTGEWIETGKYASNALALWENYDNPDEKLLIIGLQGGLYNTTTSSYTHGYVEFELNPDGSFNAAAPRHDPGSLKSIIVGLDQDRYKATIGKYPINYLFQAPVEIDSNMTFFASTQTQGLWSYRNRGSIDKPDWQWNAEERNNPNQNP